MSERLSQKQIKQDIREDEVQSFLITAIERFQENRSTYVGIAVALVLGSLAVIGLMAFLRSQKDKASEDLAQAIRVYGAEISEDAKPDDLMNPSFATEDEKRARAEEVIGDVGGGVAGDVASLYQAQLALEAGDKAKAREIWEKFLRSYSDHALAVSVRVNLIRLDREEDKAQEVADRLQQELDGANATLPEDLLIFELAKTRQELGQTEEAADLFQRILDEYPTSAFASEARQQTTSG
ncbi:MAG: tetratricopeptide repeat protein [Acidobacteriota bacterium]